RGGARRSILLVNDDAAHEQGDRLVGRTGHGNRLAVHHEIRYLRSSTDLWPLVGAEGGGPGGKEGGGYGVPRQRQGGVGPSCLGAVAITLPAGRGVDHLGGQPAGVSMHER